MFGVLIVTIYVYPVSAHEVLLVHTLYKNVTIGDYGWRQASDYGHQAHKAWLCPNEHKRVDGKKNCMISLSMQHVDTHLYQRSGCYMYLTI